MKSKTKKILFSVISGLTIIGTSLGLGLGFGLPKKDLDGISNTDTSSYTSIGEIWKSDKKVFNGENLNKLYKSITGNSSATIANIDSLASSTATAADIRTNNGGKDIVVRLGGLDWQVMYLSKDNDGNAIATLWLSNNYQDAFKGRSQTEGLYHGYYNGGLYSDWAADQYNDYFMVNYPTNMYGSSYISVVTLNNGGTYVKMLSETFLASAELITVEPSTSSAFAEFTIPVDGKNNDLTDFIVTPNKVPYQAGENAPLNSVYQAYTLPNESTTPLAEGYWYTDSTGASASVMTSNKYYYAWTDDYLWLPSLSETGYNESYLGIWKASVAQRQNHDGSTNSISIFGAIGSSNVNGSPPIVYNYSCLRSGSYGTASTAFFLYPSGISDGRVCSVILSQAVRPALHLNLDLADECREPPSLTLDLNGGKYNGSTATIKASNLKKGDNYSLPVPTREGYRFVGWVPTTNYEDASLSTLGKFDRSWSHNTDPFFQSYDFRLVRYSNINSSGSAVARYLFREEQPSHSPYNWQSFLLRNDNGLTNQGRLGGFSFCTKSYADAEFFIVFQAKIPREYQMIWATNQLGNNNYSQADSFNTVCYGTGEWQTYIVWIKCHPASVGGIYSDTNYFYFTGKEGTSTAPVEFFISYASVFDATGLSGNNNYENVKARMAKGGTYTVGSGDQTLVALWETDEWTDYADMSWEGSGTQASPYLISSAEELAGIAYSANFKQTSFSGKYFRQTKPIYLGGKEWITIKTFGGIYDGGNFEITNLEMHNNDYTHAGLFGFCWGATIKNIILNNAYIVRTGDCVGGIVGYFETSTITNCSVQGFLKGNRWVGGIIGSGYAVNISHCSFSGTVEATGGLAGGITGQIKKESTISFCQNYGNVIGGYEYTGGLVGKVYQGTISNCISKGTIEGKRKVGSLVGHMSSDENGNPVLQNCSGYGYIIDNDKISAGGLVGQCDSATSVINCSFYGSCNMNYAPPFYNEANSVSSSTFSGCWVFINGKGYYSQGDFSGWTPMNNMNYGLPIQNSLYAVAIGGYSSAEVIASLQNKGFILYS